MAEFKHPVTRATEEQNADAINNLNKSELVYVLADAFGLESPTDDDGEVIHPDDYNGNVSREMLVSLINEGYDIDADDADDDDEDSEETESDDDADDDDE